MIVKLVKADYVLHVEADTVLQQTTESGCIDLEICRGGMTVRRCLIGETNEDTAEIMGQKIPGVGAVTADFARAYIMEHGKTVDTVKRWGYPIPSITLTRSTGGGKNYTVPNPNEITLPCAGT